MSILTIKPAYITEWHNKETMDHLLTRDWFVDDESISELLMHADQEAWEWILANRRKFSSRIQKNIEFISSYFSPIQLQHVQVSEISDPAWSDIHTKHIRDMETEFDMLWKEYLKTAPSRPKTNIDKHMDDIGQQIKNANEVIEKHIEMQKKKYLTPAARLKNVDTRLQELQSTIRSLHQESERTQKHIDELEDSFQKNKKKEFRFTWLTSS
jgi:hypothetical protein